MTRKPRLLVLSHVLPFPGTSGQQQRVLYTLESLRAFFHLTFAAAADSGESSELKDKLDGVADEAVWWPSPFARNRRARAWHRGVGLLYCAWTGLKFSNYRIGKLEFSRRRLRAFLEKNRFDCALFEYWHAVESVAAFHEHGIPCVLDMHNILWQSQAQRLSEKRGLAGCWRARSLRKYRQREEEAWDKFDALIAINRQEHQYVAGKTSAQLFYAPMGIDLAKWPYSWTPSRPPRVAYYGGLGSRYNEEAALRCVRRIMPEVWRTFPEAELWLIGSNPTDQLRAFTADSRVKVTGFVERLQPVLSTMSVVLCPWVGTYGFRSRLIEVMALGVPVVATFEAVNGMELENGEGLLLGTADGELAKHALRLLAETGFAGEQSRLARLKMESLYSMASTYGRLAQELHEWLPTWRKRAS